MIYFLKSDITGDAVKIGMSNNPQGRVKQFNLPGCEILATVQGGRDKETELHTRFARLRLGDSEWFSPGPDLLSYIDSLQKPSTISDLWKCARRLYGEVTGDG